MSGVSEAAGSSSEGVGDYYCYTCQVRIQPITEDVLCPLCNNGFVVEHSLLNVLVEGERDTTTPNQPSVEASGSAADVQSLMETSLRNALSNTGMMTPGVIQLSINGGQPTRMRFPADPSTSNSNQPRRTGASASATPSGGGRDTRSRFLQHVLGGGGGGGGGSGGAAGGNVEMDFISDIMNRAFGAAGAANFETETFDIPFVFPQNVRVGGLASNPQDYAWGPNGFDNIISQLLGQIDNVGPPPATNQTIDQLPLVKITAKQVEDRSECSVCFDYFKLDEQVKKLPCSHLFHQKCIDPWLRLHNTCPICRKTIGQPQPQQQQQNTTPSTTTASAAARQQGQTSGTAPAAESPLQPQNYVVETFFPFFTPSSSARGRPRRRSRRQPHHYHQEGDN